MHLKYPMQCLSFYELFNNLRFGDQRKRPGAVPANNIPNSRNHSNPCRTRIKTNDGKSKRGHSNLSDSVFLLSLRFICLFGFFVRILVLGTCRTLLICALLVRSFFVRGISDGMNATSQTLSPLKKRHFQFESLNLLLLSFTFRRLTPI